MFSGVGLPEILIVLVIALVVLGPKRLPEVGKSLGRGMREFKESISGDDKDDHDELESYTTQTSAPPSASAATASSTESQRPSDDA